MLTVVFTSKRTTSNKSQETLVAQMKAFADENEGKPVSLDDWNAFRQSLEAKQAELLSADSRVKPDNLQLRHDHFEGQLVAFNEGKHGLIWLTDNQADRAEICQIAFVEAPDPVAETTPEGQQ